MKRLSLLLASAMLAVVSVFAQPKKPTPPSLTYVSWADAVANETPVALYNVEAGLFLSKANDWGTRASVVQADRDKGSISDLISGNATVNALSLKISKREETDFYYIAIGGAWLTSDDFNAEGEGTGIWVDGNEDRRNNANGSYAVTALDGNTFKITAVRSGTDEPAAYSLGAQKLDNGDTRVYIMEGANTTWALVKTEDVTDDVKKTLLGVQYQLNVYRGQLALYDFIESAKKDGSKVDFSKYNALISAGQETEKEAAQKQRTAIDEALSEAIDLVGLEKQESASLTNPVDITEYIRYVKDGELSDAGWTGAALNTWSVEGGADNDGTNMVTPFLQYHTANGTLSDAKFYRDQKKAAFSAKPGAYRITANVRVYNEEPGDKTYMTGAYLFGNANRVNLFNPDEPNTNNATQGATYGSYSTKDHANIIWYWKDGFETYAIVPNDGTFNFGVQVEDANFNWVATKGWKVEYLGAAFDALDKVRTSTELTIPNYDFNETKVTKALQDKYTNAKATYASGTKAEDVLAAYGDLNVVAEELPANIAAWKAYADLVETILNDEVTTDPCDEAQALNSYVNDNDEPAEGAYNGNGTYMHIVAALALTTEEVEAETKWLSDLYATAVKNAMKEGADVSFMLVNPKFKDGFTGWDMPNTVDRQFGGLKAFPAVEVYQAAVDISQTVEGVRDGIYSISCRAFERPTWNGQYNGEEKPLVYLYMNDFRTPVQSIVKDMLPADKAIDLTNCYIKGGNLGDLQFPNVNGAEGADAPLWWNEADNVYSVSNDENGMPAEFYVPNGMNGASIAFQAGRYEQKVYGLVEGGTMKIGLTSNGEKGRDAHWVLWSDFTLTYEGKTKEAITAVIDAVTERVNEFRKTANLSTGMDTALENATGNAELAAFNGDVDAMWDALIALNKLYADAEEFEPVYEDFQKKVAELDFVWDNMEEILNEAPSAEKGKAYDNTSSSISDAETNADLAGIKALMKEIDKTIGLLRVPNDYASASDNDPVDMTCTIVNPDFEASLDPEAEIGVLNPTYPYVDAEGNEIDLPLTGWSFNSKAAGDTQVHNIYTNAEHIYTAGELNQYYFEASLDNGGEENNFVFNTWNGDSIGVDGFWLQQTVRSLPAGMYQLEADLASDAGNRVKLYINDKRMPYIIPGNEEADADEDADADADEDADEEVEEKVAPKNAGIHAVHIYELEEGADFVIKVASGTWFKADNFKLTYYGTDSKFEPTEIEDVEADDAASAPVAIYTVAGAKVSSLQKGINIVKYANGKVVKVLVK